MILNHDDYKRCLADIAALFGGVVDGNDIRFVSKRTPSFSHFYVVLGLRGDTQDHRFLIPHLTVGSVPLANSPAVYGAVLRDAAEVIDTAAFESTSFAPQEVTS